MSGKGMQEAGRKGWEGERAVRHNGAAAFINFWISVWDSGREERTERWTRGEREDTARWVNKAAKVKGQLLYQTRGMTHQFHSTTSVNKETNVSHCEKVSAF